MDPQRIAAPAGVSRPNQARVYNYLQGGRDHYCADREAGDEIERVFPGMSVLVARQREFARHAAAWLAARGIGQFIDVGCGTAQPVGEVMPGARVACVDSDPEVLTRLRALPGREGFAVAGGDVARPDLVLADPGLLEVIDLARPAAVLLAGVLGAMDADTAMAVAAGYAGALAPGSALVVSCVSYASQEAGDEASRAYHGVTGGTWHSHSRETIAGFFGDLLMMGAVSDVRAWWGPVSADERDVAVIGGVGLRR